MRRWIYWEELDTLFNEGILSDSYGENVTTQNCVRNSYGKIQFPNDALWSHWSTGRLPAVHEHLTG